MPHYERFAAAFPTAPACAAAGPGRGGAPVVGARLQPAGPEPAPGRGGRRGRPRRVSCRTRTPPSARCPASARTRRGPCAPSPSATTWPPSTPTACASWPAAWRARPSRCARRRRSGDQLVPAGASWEFNQAMFDLGATVCTAARPDCARCPLRRQCAWRRQGSRRCRPVAPEPDGAAARAPSPARTARGGGACSTRCAGAACGRATWPAPAAGPTTGPGPSGWRPPWWPRGSPAGPAARIPSSGCTNDGPTRRAPPRWARSGGGQEPDDVGG